MTALLHLTNDWYLNIDKGENNLIVLLDLAKAFDTVSHEILLKKLKLYGLEGVTLDWFSSYLSNRQKQCVFDYCDVVWDNLDQGLSTKLQKLQNRAARIINFQGYEVCSAQIRKQLNWEDLASGRQKHLSLLMYDAINKNVPSYISDLFSNVCENNPYKSKLRNKEHNVMLGRTPKTE